jgi:hypothetical protein
MVRTGAYEQVQLSNTSSEILSPVWIEPVALLWLDGEHSSRRVKRDFDSSSATGRRWRPRPQGC